MNHNWSMRLINDGITTKKKMVLFWHDVKKKKKEGRITVGNG